MALNGKAFKNARATARRAFKEGSEATAKAGQEAVESGIKTTRRKLKDPIDNALEEWGPSKPKIYKRKNIENPTSPKTSKESAFEQSRNAEKQRLRDLLDKEKNRQQNLKDVISTDSPPSDPKRTTFSAFSEPEYKKYAERNNVDEQGLKSRQLKNGLKEKHKDKITPKVPKKSGANWVYGAGATAIGGGILFSMSNNKGQQSNSQLYGQY